jgi:alanine dehydrogenase
MARKRRRADRGGAGVVDGGRRSKTDVTVIDTSTQGWKAAKLLIRRGTAWRVRDRQYSEISETEEVNKGKRRAGLVAKVLRDREREKEAALPVSALIFYFLQYVNCLICLSLHVLRTSHV